MKKFLIFLGVALSALSFSAFSQNIQSTNRASAQTQSASTSQNLGQGNGNSITFNSTSPDSVTQKFAPSMGGPQLYGSFSPSSCMVSAGVGVSVIGFGGQAATPIQDDNCNNRQDFLLLMQASMSTQSPNEKLAMQTAARDIMCSRGGAVYEAMAKQGLCSIERNDQGVSVKASQNRMATNKQLDEFYGPG